MKKFTVLLALLALLTGCAAEPASAEPSVPSIDLTSIPQAVAAGDDLQIGGRTFAPYCDAAPVFSASYYGLNIPDSFSVGKILAYSTDGTRYMYYAEVGGLDHWLISYADRGTGQCEPGWVDCFWRETSETNIPRWIEDCRKALMDATYPGSYPGLPEGFTLYDPE